MKIFEQIANNRVTAIIKRTHINNNSRDASSQLILHQNMARAQSDALIISYQC